jgi:hypothetical protein
LSFITAGWCLRIQYNISIVPDVQVGIPCGAHDVRDTWNGNPMKEGGGSASRRPGGCDPPTPPGKKGQGYPLPHPSCQEAIPPPRGTFGVPPSPFPDGVSRRRGNRLSQPGLGCTPTPHCFEPTMGTPCHHFYAWDPPSPPAQKGQGSLDPTPRVRKPYPHPGVPLGYPPPLFRMECHVGEATG